MQINTSCTAIEISAPDYVPSVEAVLVDVEVWKYKYSDVLGAHCGLVVDK